VGGVRTEKSARRGTAKKTAEDSTVKSFKQQQRQLKAEGSVKRWSGELHRKNYRGSRVDLMGGSLGIKWEGTEDKRGSSEGEGISSKVD